MNKPLFLETCTKANDLLMNSSLPVKGVWKTNLLEDDLEKVSHSTTESGISFKVTLRPFEVATYRLLLD